MIEFNLYFSHSALFELSSIPGTNLCLNVFFGIKTDLLWLYTVFFDFEQYLTGATFRISQSSRFWDSWKKGLKQKKAGKVSLRVFKIEAVWHFTLCRPRAVFLFYRWATAASSNLNIHAPIYSSNLLHITILYLFGLR